MIKLSPAPLASLYRCFILALALLAGTQALAQEDGVERCGTQVLKDRLPKQLQAYMPGGAAFEHWMAMRTAARDTSADTAVLRIPVVFHVIHKGEPVGMGTNLSDDVLRSQIRVLNEDYRRRPGTRGYNADPRGADAHIEFVLATTDTNGQYMPGIFRINGGNRSFTVGDNDEIKAFSIQPYCQYLNIWVCDLTGFLGYGSFPVSTLPFNGSVTYSQPDGVVVSYKYVGVNSTFSRLYRLGRTITHEIGHYLGLIHVWGDGDCSATDFCRDTPSQDGPNYICPPMPRACPGELPNMNENFLNYTPDSCMNLFTADQVFRMRYVLRNSDCRTTLTTSIGLTPTKRPIPKAEAPLLRFDTETGNIVLQLADSMPVEAVLLDQLGRPVERYASEGGSLFAIDPRGMADGLYFLRVVQGGQQSTLRLVVPRELYLGK